MQLISLWPSKLRDSKTPGTIGFLRGWFSAATQIVEAALHPQKQTQLALIGFFVHPKCVMKSAKRRTSIKIVLENVFEVVERVDPVGVVHGEHDHVLGGVEDGLEFGALGDNGVRAKVCR